MINDEFTNLKANNDSFIKKTEFANLPDSEFSDAGEMNLHRAAYDASLQVAFLLFPLLGQSLPVVRVSSLLLLLSRSLL